MPDTPLVPPQPSDDLAPNELAGMPTKTLFVEMLTRDIGLNRAVLDLIDNSIDGARRLRPNQDETLAGLEIDIKVNATQFAINDNCGGIDMVTARKYAFRFGRPKDMPPTPGSVGQFGVGMKRALFKFGRYFVVDSSTVRDRFVLKVDVDLWERDEKVWKFKFDEMEEGLQIPLSETGTKITVTRLREDAASAFGVENFLNALSREIESTQQHYIDRGLRIVFNGRTMLATPWQLLSGDGLQPGRFSEEFKIGTSQIPVYVRIFVGVGESRPRQAGWYVFCNGRLVLEAEQSAVTGWSALADSETAIPKYHNQFARFRGFVFFDSPDTGVLPWNTTKTGVDQDSATYKAALLRMIEAMRPVITFLNQLDAEKDSPETDRPLTGAIERANSVTLNYINSDGPFTQPVRLAPTGPPMTNIRYRRPSSAVGELQEALNARTPKEAGEVSFDLIYKQYVEEG